MLSKQNLELFALQKIIGVLIAPIGSPLLRKLFFIETEDPSRRRDKSLSFSLNALKRPVCKSRNN